MRQATILGAGISGLTTSFFMGHENCLIYESKPYYGGHIYSEIRDGFTWDDGPHVSFTESEFVQELFAESVGGAFEEFETIVGNYHQGHWLDHPAQSNLYQVPEPLRTKCLESFLEARKSEPFTDLPGDYREWLHRAFGPVFADTFPAAYTRKYWTTEPENLGVDWIGKRIFYPEVEDVRAGYFGPLQRKTYWVKKFRYPSNGGFLAYAHRFAKGAQINYCKTVQRIHFGRRELRFHDGSEASYEALISTLPLPVLIKAAEDVPDDVRDAAAALRCTNFLQVEVAVRHPCPRPEQWIYVYDEDKLSTRISVTEHFSPNNAPKGMSGLAVEVYGSDYRPLPAQPGWGSVGERVKTELIQMGLIENAAAIASSHVRYSPWGNVIFDHQRRGALKTINDFLDGVGVTRIGRFAEWKYLMTHDCALHSRRVAEGLKTMVNA